MPSGRRKFVVRHPVVVDIGCSCRRAKLPSFFSSLPKPKPPKTPSLFSHSTTTSSTTTTTASHWETSLTASTTRSTSPSPSHYHCYTSSASPTFRAPEKSPKKAKKKKTKKGIVEESVAVVKESSDPYVDFRESMLQMIVEREIYAWEDLRDLLHRFLVLNSPYHHHLILRAFAEIWHGLLTPPSSGADTSFPEFRQ